MSSENDAGSSAASESAAVVDSAIKNPSLDAVCMMILSRIAECVRFHIPQSLLDVKVTKTHFLDIVAATAKGEDEVEAMRGIYDRLEATRSVPISVTFRQLLKYETGCFPVTTAEQRDRLTKYAEAATLIRRGDVAALLSVSETHPIVEYLFASGVEALPGEVFQDIVACLGAHPLPPSFMNEMSSAMVATGSRMLTLLPFLAMVIVGLIHLPRLGNVDYYEAMQTTLHFIEADWATGCPDGPLSSKGCHFVQRNLHEIDTIDVEAMRYVREEFIMKLWQSSGRTAAEAPLGYVDFPPVGSVGSTYPIGALLIRHVDAKDAKGRSATLSCSDLNISVGIGETRAKAAYPCDATWAIAIPFNATQEEALAAASKATLPLDSAERSSAIVLQFASFQPSTALFTYTTVTLSFPRGGHVITRVDFRVADLDAHEIIEPILIANVIVMAISVGFACFYTFGFGREFLRLDLFLDVLMLVLVATAYGLLKHLPTPDSLYGVEYVPNNADAMTSKHYTAQVLMAVWGFLSLGGLSKYAKEVGALQIVVAIVQVAGLEILALVLVFGVWTLAFALIATIFFGNVDPPYATPFNAFVELFDFFSGGGDYDLLLDMHPILGPIFWYVFTIFVSFFALNLLIAVLTAPLEAVKEACNLHDEMNTAVAVDIEGDRKQKWLDRQRYYLLRSLAPYINIFYDCVPNLAKKKHWLLLETGTQALTNCHAHESIVIASEGAHHVLDQLVNPKAATPYISRLIYKCRELKCMDPISMAFTVTALASMSDNDIVRDARLNRILMLYDNYTTNMDKLMDTQQALASQAFAMSSIPEEEEKAEEMEGSLNVKLTPRYLQTERTSSEELSAMEHFNFTLHVETTLNRARWRWISFVITATIFVWMFATGLTLSTDSAFLSASLDEGLRNFPIKEECFDNQCKSAFTFRKTFMDTGDMADVYVWVEKVLKRQLYSTPPVNGSQPMLWDRRITLDSPLYFRQMRGQERPCKFRKPPSDGALASGWYEKHVTTRIDNQWCSTSMSGPFATHDMHRPNTSMVDGDAYKHQDSCISVRRGLYYGMLSQYQCNGYTATIHNVTELDALMASGWLDNATRFVAIIANYTIGGVGLEYSMNLEMGRGGGTATPHVVTVALSEDEDTLFLLMLLPLLVVDLELLLFIVLSLRKVYQKGVRNYRPPMPIPTYAIVVDVFCLIFPYILYQDPNYLERLKIQIGVVALGITYRASQEVFFPVAGLLSKEATTLFDTLARAATQCMLVVPFYIIFLVGLAISGMVMFATTARDFASFRFAILAVIRGALGDWDTHDLENARPEAVEVFNLIFYALVLIMLANMILAMVTSAANDAMVADQSVNLAERICKARGWHPMYGAIYEFFLAWNVWSLKRENQDASSTHRKLLTIAVHDKRVLFLVESLTTALGPHRANEVLESIHLDSVHESLFPSAVVFILQLHADYAKAYMVEEAVDKDREHSLLAVAPTLNPHSPDFEASLAQSVGRGGGVTPPTKQLQSSEEVIVPIRPLDHHDGDEAAQDVAQPMETAAGSHTSLSNGNGSSSEYRAPVEQVADTGPTATHEIE